MPVKIDWDYWNKIGAISLENALFLSLGYDPRRTRSLFLSKKVIFRTEMIRGNVLSGRLKVTRMHSDTLLESSVLLEKFADWALEMGWDIPGGLAELSKTNHKVAKTPVDRRKSLDISTMRGNRRSILEHWDDIEARHGPTPDAHEVRRFLHRQMEKGIVESVGQLKTIQNHLSKLRKEGLIP